jgi:hypothetical protein
MGLTKTTRGAIIATINSIALRSEWFALPVDNGNFAVVFIHKRAATLFGACIQTADLFTSAGDASRLATEIFLIASCHGWVAHSAGMTNCPILVQASEAGAFSEKDYA